jgi:hypothetical protein
MYKYIGASEIWKRNFRGSWDALARRCGVGGRSKGRGAGNYVYAYTYKDVYTYIEYI